MKNLILSLGLILATQSAFAGMTIDQNNLEASVKESLKPMLGSDEAVVSVKKIDGNGFINNFHIEAVVKDNSTNECAKLNIDQFSSSESDWYVSTEDSESIACPK